MTPPTCTASNAGNIRHLNKGVRTLVILAARFVIRERYVLVHAQTLAVLAELGTIRRPLVPPAHLHRPISHSVKLQKAEKEKIYPDVRCISN